MTLREHLLAAVLGCKSYNDPFSTMILTGRLAGIVAALLSLIFLLSGLAQLRGSETSGNYVSSGLGKASNGLQDVQNRTLGV
jgi:hypothetical protein